MMASESVEHLDYEGRFAWFLGLLSWLSERSSSGQEITRSLLGPDAPAPVPAAVGATTATTLTPAATAAVGGATTAPTPAATNGGNIAVASAAPTPTTEHRSLFTRRKICCSVPVVVFLAASACFSYFIMSGHQFPPLEQDCQPEFLNPSLEVPVEPNTASEMIKLLELLGLTI